MTALHPIPPALAALAPYDALRQQISASLLAQTQLISERLSTFVLRPDLISTLDTLIRDVGSGIITLDGSPGSGATTLLCHLAATRRAPFWLPDADAGDGLAALCGQVIALYNLPVPMVPPNASRDATTLERLLAEAAATRTSADPPLVVLIDQLPDEQAAAELVPFPAAIPPGVVIVYGGATNVAAAHLAMPSDGATLQRVLIEIAVRHGCTLGLAETVAAQSGGSPLYVRLVSGLLQTGVLRRFSLPETLDGLYDAWWRALDSGRRRLAVLLAAASEPLPITLLADLSGVSQIAVGRTIERWQPLLELQHERVAFYHPSITAAITRAVGGTLSSAHAAYVTPVMTRTGGEFEKLDPVSDIYAMRNMARHIALSDPVTRAAIPLLVNRAWIKAQERRTNDGRAAAADAAWELRAVVTEGRVVPMVRVAALASTLAVLGRSISPEGLAEAFSLTLERGEGRETALRRAQALVDQLPPGRDKAQVLRRLGEVCHDHRMRAPAMRMLSEALDYEVPGLPRFWRDEREETLVAFARAAINISTPDMALGITTQIVHAERRGLIETEVVRWLLAYNALTRAEEVAYAIAHPHTHEWAMAEVAVGHARTGNASRAEEVLSTLRTESAVAWARGELAADAARRGDGNAAATLVRITSERLRNQALVQVAPALVAGGHPNAALDATRQISEREMRARTLLELGLLRPANAALVLAYAAEDTAALGDDRTPLQVTLSMAYATIGNIEQALKQAAVLSEGEERDRAHSRIAIALARNAQHAAAYTIASAIPDDDERCWTLHDLSRLRAEGRDWPGAAALVNAIGDDELRSRAAADVCIVRARSGAAAFAQELIGVLDVPAERTRASIAIADALVQQGGAQRARGVFAQMSDPAARSRYGLALASALAAHGDFASAHDVARAIPRPFDHARALINIARTAAPRAPEQALRTFGQALRVAASLGRTETFACLAAAAEVLAALGGPEILLAAAHALDEVDSWWA